MKTITIRNYFHNTSARVRVEELVEFEALDWEPPRKAVAATLTQSQYKRTARKLCGMADCTCGRISGPQEHKGKLLEIKVGRV